MTFFRFARTALIVSLLCGCSYVPRVISEFKIDVQQGNVLTQDMVAQLRPGQTRDQVRFILGSPMLTDMFHSNRWDYVYRYTKGSSGESETRKFSVFFDENDRLVRVAGDVEAAQSTDMIAVPQARAKELDLGSVAPDAALPPAAEERGFWGGLLNKIGF